MTIDKIKILTFAKGNFLESQSKLKNHLTNLGLSNQIHLTDEDLPNDFLEKYKNILKHKKGFGYCIWKPYIILKQLNLLKDDEVLFYIDSTDQVEKVFFDFLLPHLEKEDYLLLNRGYNNGEWTKRDTFILMDCDTQLYHSSTQLEAGIIVMKPTDFNKKIISEWFSYCENENILTEIPNISKFDNLQNFKEHRYDQSVLTNIALKYQMKNQSFSSQYIKFNFYQPKIY